MNDHTNPGEPSGHAVQHGAHNQGTFFLTMRNVRNLYAAISCANAGGAVLDTMLTINWPLVRAGGQFDHLDTFYQWKKCFGQWIQDNGCSYIIHYYVHENPGDAVFHTHMAAHLEPQLKSKFRSWAETCLEKLSGTKGLHPNAFDLEIRYNGQNLIGQWRWFNYVCKGLSPTEIIPLKNGYRYEARQLIARHLEPQGFVLGRKRCGVSEVLCNKSRAQFWSGEAESSRHPFISELDRQMTSGQFDPSALYTDVEYRMYLERQATIDL